jgi:hypothetical protein
MVSAWYWKTKRELRVLAERALYAPFHLVAPLLQRLYDKWAFPRLKRHLLGELATCSRVAVLLSHSVHGLPVRVFAAIERLRGSQFAVLVVANGGLEPSAIERLTQAEASVLLRPNWGYDFGGYRDGIRLLGLLGAQPAELILMNDSIEYPIFADDTLIEDMQRSGKDFVGAVHAKPYNSPDFGVLFSFFLWVSAEALRSIAWQDFWHRYVMTGSKYATVRRGERALTQAMCQVGLRCGGVYTREAFLNKARELDTNNLRTAIEYGVYVGDEAFAARAGGLLALNPSADQWRALALTFIEDVVAKRNFMYCFPYITYGALGMPFLKRSGAAAQRIAYELFGEFAKQHKLTNWSRRAARL